MKRAGHFGIRTPECAVYLARRRRGSIGTGLADQQFKTYAACCGASAGLCTICASSKGHTLDHGMTLIK